MSDLKDCLAFIEKNKPKSKEYMLGLNMEVELKKYQNPAFEYMPDDFYIKLQQLLRDNQPQSKRSSIGAWDKSK